MESRRHQETGRVSLVHDALVMLIDEAIQRWHREVTLERRLSASTVAQYHADLVFFSRQHAGLTTDQVTHELLAEYLRRRVEDQHVQPNTQARETSSLATWGKWLLESKILPVNPAARLHRPKLAKRLPVYLEQRDVGRLLDALDQGTWSGARDHAMVVVFVNTGLRISELLGLRLGDVNLDACSLRVMGKGSRERVVPLNDMAEESMRRWLGIRGRAGSDHDHVFVAQHGGALTARAFQAKLRHLRDVLGLPGLTPHKLRHTFATMLHMSGVDVVEIQPLMGHASIVSTQIYTHTTGERLRASVARLPRFDGAPSGPQMIAGGAAN